MPDSSSAPSTPHTPGDGAGPEPAAGPTVFGPGPAVLMCDGTPVAPLVVADTRATRRRGLLGSDSLAGALWLGPCSSVHCVGMRYPIDVALVDRRGRVRKVATLPPGRMTLPSP